MKNAYDGPNLAAARIILNIPDLPESSGLKMWARAVVARLEPKEKPAEREGKPE